MSAGPGGMSEIRGEVSLTTGFGFGFGFALGFLGLGADCASLSGFVRAAAESIEGAGVCCCLTGGNLNSGDTMGPASAAGGGALTAEGPASADSGGGAGFLEKKPNTMIE